MRTFTTCQSCDQPLEVMRHRHDTHDDCPPPTGYIHDLERDFLAAVHAGQDAEAEQLAHRIDAYDTRPPQLLAAALAYAAWGWPVFPCRPGRKTPLTRHGFHEASTDPEVITAWWQATPAANVGLATGGRFDVLDLDPAGLAGWAGRRDQSDDQPDFEVHGQVSTPRAGLHLYLPPTGGGNLANVAPGIDYRGVGGYVLAPPSQLGPEAYQGKLLPTGGPPWRYSWWIRPSPALTGQGVGS